MYVKDERGKKSKNQATMPNNTFLISLYNIYVALMIEREIMEIKKIL